MPRLVIVYEVALHGKNFDFATNGSYMRENKEDFGTIIETARTGAGSQLGQILVYFQPHLTKFAEKSVGPSLSRRMSASDLVQDTLLSATSQFPSFRGQSELELKSWLMELIKSRLADGLRRHKFAARRAIDREVTCTGSAIDDSHPTPAQVVASREETKNLLDTIQMLSPDAQKIVRMRYLENQSFESIAQTMGMSLTTVWRHWASALEKIRIRLQ